LEALALLEADALMPERKSGEERLERVFYLAEHLLQQVPEFTGVVSPDGHKEDDYIRDQLGQEFREHKEALAAQLAEAERELELRAEESAAANRLLTDLRTHLAEAERRKKELRVWISRLAQCLDDHIDYPQAASHAELRDTAKLARAWLQDHP
jgi:primosomal protein N''